MSLVAKLAPAAALLPLRTRYREEMNCQIVHDSIHARDGWTKSYYHFWPYLFASQAIALSSPKTIVRWL